MSGVLPGCAPSHVIGHSGQWPAWPPGAALTHLPLRGQRRVRMYSPASLFHSVDPAATEHLKQAAKVRGLGVERQLKPPLVSAQLLVRRPAKNQQSATPEELQDTIEDLQQENTCAAAWYFPLTPIASCATRPTIIIPASPYCSSKPTVERLNHRVSRLLYE